MTVTESEFAIEIEGGVTVCVPADINLMTPYILLEQEDWFEDEIKFVRAFLQPGMRVIDIGVNYGTYFLTAAKRIGQKGKIWGFEPSTQCCTFLESSIAANGFHNTQLIQAGLSNRVGKAYLSLSENTELNTVSDNLEAGTSGESIELLTLDHCLEKMGLTEIDFIKIDAEGEESNIIEGGKNFFESNSPLVMFELKHGATINQSLINEFGKIGYRTYYLVPGLNCLAEFDAGGEIDGYQLNLFAIKEDMNEKLTANGCIAVDESSSLDLERVPRGIWREYLLRFPFGRELFVILGEDMDRSSEREFADYYRALDFFAYSQDSDNRANLRFGALKESCRILGTLLQSHGNVSFALTFVRTLSALGRRQQAVGLTSTLIGFLKKSETYGLPVPFLAPCKEFDSMEFGEEPENWLYSSIFTANQFLSAFSSYYMNADNMGLLELIKNLNFVAPEIKRRRMLSALRYSRSMPHEAKQSVVELTERGGNRNIWSELVAKI